MKHIIRLLILAVTLVAGLMTVSAQTVTVDVRQKVRPLPATATNYLDDPFRYFDIVFYAVGTGGSLDIYFDFDYSLNDGSFYLRTDPNKAPTQKITIHDGQNIMRREEMLSQLRGRKSTNVDLSKPLDAQLLPEGTYQLCVDVYLWSDKDNPARVPISVDGPCPSYEVCYSGSAPELVSPLASAHTALNGTMVLTPARKVNFIWTPVISNCTEKNKTRFKYQLKVVKVLNGQNYRDAIKINPTVLSIEVKNQNMAVFDTLRDLKVQMEKGVLYVAQVHADPINTNNNGIQFQVANDGNSQPLPFFWGYAADHSNGLFDDYAHLNYGDVEEGDIEEGEESEGIDGLTHWEGGVEEVSEWETIEDELTEPYLVLNPKRHFVESDGYVTIPSTNDLEIGFKPVQHESLKNITYTIALYNNVDGDVDSITANEPLLSETIKDMPENKTDSQDLVNRTLAGWGAKLEQGNLYYLQLSSAFTVDYWKYSIADTSFYVNEMLAEHIYDTVSRDFVTEEMELANGVFFQWGDDPEAPEYTTPQWKAPLDRTGDDIYDPVNYAIPATVPVVQQAKAFSVSWAPVQGVIQGDEVQYEVNVYELKPGQTVEEAVSENKVLVSRTITDANGISETDAKFFKVFSSQKTYVMTLSTTVNSESNTYHFKNGNDALPIVFKIAK